MIHFLQEMMKVWGNMFVQDELVSVYKTSAKLLYKGFLNR